MSLSQWKQVFKRLKPKAFNSINRTHEEEVSSIPFKYTVLKICKKCNRLTKSLIHKYFKQSHYLLYLNKINTWKCFISTIYFSVSLKP